MIHSLKPYPSYKDSGVPWLGQVPVAWKIVALRHRYFQCLGKMLDSKRIVGNYLVPYLRNVDVQWGRISTSSLPLMDIPPEEYDRYTVKLGDLLVCEGGEVGRAAVWQGKPFVCGFQKALHRLRPISFEDLPRFMFYVFRVAAVFGAFSDGHESTIAHLTGEKLRGHRFAFPDLSEQSAIVRFLDHADRRIRRYIHAKKKLIALLNEQKQAIIHCAVTRGLNPNVRLKPSGVEWLGEVPEHWEVKPLKRLLTRMDYGTSENLGREGNIQVLTMGHIKEGEIVPPTHGSLNSVPEGLLLEKHDLLFNRTNSPDLVGKVGIFRGTADDTITFASYLVRLRTKKGHDPNWLNCLLNSTRFWAYARSQAYISLHQANLNSTRYGQMLLPVPLGPEQIQIAEYLGACLEGLDEAANAARMAIDLLHEYRTRLIADVVTGKLDVCEAAARLPDEAEEPEPLDESEAVGEDEAEGESAGLDALSEEAIA